VVRIRTSERWNSCFGGKIEINIDIASIQAHARRGKDSLRCLRFLNIGTRRQARHYKSVSHDGTFVVPEPAAVFAVASSFLAWNICIQAQETVKKTVSSLFLLLFAVLSLRGTPSQKIAQCFDKGEIRVKVVINSSQLFFQR